MTHLILVAFVFITAVMPVPPQESTEAARVRQLEDLIQRREQAARADKPSEVQACDAEIKRLPEPKEQAAGALAKRMVGKWRSTRHDHLYRANGTYTMLSADKESPHGKWRIDGNQLETTSSQDATNAKTRYTLILLTEKRLVYTDGEFVFFETRLSR